MQDVLDRAVRILRAGGVVIYPTETLYGLAADPCNAAALEKLFQIKKRSPDKPVLLLISCFQQLFQLVETIPWQYQAIIDRYWPGPLTLIFPARKTVLPGVTAGSGTVGIRFTAHPLAVSLIEAFGGPITGTSANLSGMPAVQNLSDLPPDFFPRCDMAIDGGQTAGGQGSTLVAIKEGRAVIVRQGILDFPFLLEG